MFINFEKLDLLENLLYCRKLVVGMQHLCMVLIFWRNNENGNEAHSLAVKRINALLIK